MADASASEFSKFCKFFTIRLVQAVVQSRLGQKIKTNCDVAAADWFNVRVEELGEVTGEIRAATQGRFPPECSSVCLDFQLQTSEGEFLPLESWVVAFDAAAVDPNVGVRSHLYHQLSTLLRSAIAAARLTPLYRYYARRQGPDSFIVCYNIHEGLPDLGLLGAGSRSLQLGALPCPFGTLSLDLHFRTKMVISDSEEATKSPPRPVHHLPDPHNLPPNSPSSEDDAVFSVFSTSPPSGLDIPWPQMAPQNRKGSVTFQSTMPTAAGLGASSSDGGSNSSHSKASTSHAEGAMNKRNSSSQALFSLDLSESGSAGKTSGGSLPMDGSKEPDKEEEEEEAEEGDFPFSALLSASSAPVLSNLANLSLHESLSKSPVKNVFQALKESGSAGASSPSLLSPTKGPRVTRITEDSRENLDDDDADSSDDSFVKVDDAGPLFIPQADIGADLGVFVRECKTAPHELKSFEVPMHSPRPAQDQPPASSLTSQLPSFQGLQSRFDDFVKSLEEAEED